MTRRPKPPPPPDLERTLHCRHFGTCGGCSLLDQPIEWQLHDKQAKCTEALQPFLGDVRIETAPPTWTPRHFRTRLLYPVIADRGGLAISGIYAFRSRELVRIEECRTQDEWLTAFGRAAGEVLRRQEVEPFSERSGRGTVKAIFARLANGSGQVLAGIVTRPGAFAAGPAIAREWQIAAKALPRVRKARELVGVVHAISDRDDDFLLGDRHVPLLGQDHVVDRCADLEFRISAGSFYQVHADAGRLLYEPALAMCGDVKGQSVVDGYGGVGAFGLRLAKAGARHVTIVEEGAAACRDAEHNAQRNGLAATVTVANTPFAGARLPTPLDLLVVDPPRAGLGPKAIARITAAAPRRILYVSCAAESLAKDLAALTKAYRVTAVRLADLFPHSEHVEVLTMLERV